jgi:glycerol-3-phosphate dehydrogenase
MSSTDLRQAAWEGLDRHWDLVVIGGGVTGAGIFLEACRAGLRTLLLEAHDFSSGTSSRSTKLVHGGFRYLQNLQLAMTYESVRERDRLLQDAPGLISNLTFTLCHYRPSRPPLWQFGLGFAVYDLIAQKWDHEHRAPGDILAEFPQLRRQELRGGYRYQDALTDDARLVYRLLQEGMEHGGTALNYAAVRQLLRDRRGMVQGVAVEDCSGYTDQSQEVAARVVVNASGGWADELRGLLAAPPRLRRLRGSHLLFPHDCLPLRHALTLLHPADGRVVFILPWEGATLVGTTDLDLDEAMATDLAITPQELDYLFELLDWALPELALTPADAISCFTGMRSVVDTGRSDPSKESRGHVIWDESGLVTVSGGKLTTFRRMAFETLGHLRSRFPGPIKPRHSEPLFGDITAYPSLPGAIPELQRLRLRGRFGSRARQAYKSSPDDLARIDPLSTLWAEVNWAARQELVIHLEDLMLRRTRLGLLLPQGGRRLLPSIRTRAQAALGWDDQRWTIEESSYLDTWALYYSPPAHGAPGERHHSGRDALLDQ